VAEGDKTYTWLTQVQFLPTPKEVLIGGTMMDIKVLAYK